MSYINTNVSGHCITHSNTNRTVFKLTKTKTFSGAAVTLYYETVNKKIRK